MGEEEPGRGAIGIWQLPQKALSPKRPFVNRSFIRSNSAKGKMELAHESDCFAYDLSFNFMQFLLKWWDVVTVINNREKWFSGTFYRPEEAVSHNSFNSIISPTRHFSGSRQKIKMLARLHYSSYNKKIK